MTRALIFIALVTSCLSGVSAQAQDTAPCPLSPGDCADGAFDCAAVCVNVNGCTENQKIHVQDCRASDGTRPIYCPAGTTADRNPVIFTRKIKCPAR